MDPRLKLVLVDDHEVARAALARRLRDHPRILVAGHTADPLEAHDIVLGHQAHAVLVDTIRQDRQGPRVVSSLSALPAHQRPAVVVHLSYYQPEHWVLARAAGADDLILKQIAVDLLSLKLLETIRRVLPADRWPAILHA
jgi:DNA-binding NarL/FixJ family response regulator